MEEKDFSWPWHVEIKAPKGQVSITPLGNELNSKVLCLMANKKQGIVKKTANANNRNRNDDITTLEGIEKTVPGESKQQKGIKSKTRAARRQQQQLQ